VSLVNPGAVDTPLWDHLESATGLLPPVPPEIYTPESVAAAVVATMRRPRDEVFAGGSARAQVYLSSHLGAAANGALTTLARLAFGAGDRPAGEGGLEAGRGAGEVRGGFGGRPSAAVWARGARDRAARVLGANR
jgi:hypothetical protein